MIESMDDLLLDSSVVIGFLIEARVVRDGVLLPSNLALNDIALSKANPGRMIEFELHIDGELIYVSRADGMIISLPTGSTAYALSGMARYFTRQYRVSPWSPSALMACPIVQLP